MDVKEAKTKLERFDRWQQSHRWSAVGLATFKKFSEDKTTNLAGLIAFWAFFSIFPLMLAFITILGYTLPSGTKQSVLNDVHNVLPVIQVSSLKGLTGAWWALLIGVVSALWSGLSVVRTVQFAFNSVWEIPIKDQPKLVEQTLRGLKILGTVGLGLVVSTFITGFASSTVNSILPAPGGTIVGAAIALVLDIGLFLAAFNMLTDKEISLKQVAPGAIVSGVIFWVLQMISSIIIGRYLHKAQGTYGAMAGVITILWWFYLQAVVTLLGAQLNVVLTQRLWPRSLIGGPDTEADHAAYQAYAAERTYHEEENVEAEFPNGPQPTSAPRGQTR
jgi:YihY family inner membrane protein